jgi:hypothetical protein
MGDIQQHAVERPAAEVTESVPDPLPGSDRERFSAVSSRQVQRLSRKANGEE